MTCSITIIRRGKPVAEVKGVDIGEPLYDDELARARRAIVQHIAEQELLDEVVEEDTFEIDVESTLLDLYEKVGILKERIEKLERR